jgi:hypothetical protein
MQSGMLVANHWASEMDYIRAQNDLIRTRMQAMSNRAETFRAALEALRSTPSLPPEVQLRFARYAIRQWGMADDPQTGGDTTSDESDYDHEDSVSDIEDIENNNTL